MIIVPSGTLLKNIKEYKLYLNLLICIILFSSQVLVSFFEKYTYKYLNLTYFVITKHRISDMFSNILFYSTRKRV